MLHVLLFAPLVVLGAEFHGTYEVGLRSEARTRTPVDLGQGPRFAADLQLTPHGQLYLTLGNTFLGLSYSPRLLLREPASGATQRADLLHQAFLNVGFHFRPRGTGFASTRMSYGQTEFTLLTSPNTAAPNDPQGTDGSATGTNTPGSDTNNAGAGAGAGSGSGGGSAGGTGGTSGSPSAGTPTNSPLQGVPLLRSVPYFESETLVGADFWPGTRLHTLAAVGYAVSGGATTAAQVGVPLQRGPVARAQVDVQPARSDVLSTQGSFVSSDFSNGQRLSILQGLQSWRHAFSARTRTELGAGVAAVRIRPPTSASFQMRYQAIASATLGQDWRWTGSRFATTYGLLYAPLVDRFRGTVLDRFEANVTGAWQFYEHWLFSIRGNVGRTMSGPQRGDLGWLLDTSAGYRLAPDLLVEAGVRQGWQHSAATGSPVVYQWLVFVAFTFTERWHH